MSQYQINKQKFLSERELESLRACLKRNKFSDPRNTLIIELLLATGARRQEILNLTNKDFWKEETYGVVFIKGLKGSDDREIPIEMALFERLKAYCGQTVGRVFPITAKRLEQIWHIYRPVNKGLHSTRHTFAIELFKRERDLRLVQLALGHRNIQNTMVYAEYVYKTSEMSRLLKVSG